MEAVLIHPFSGLLSAYGIGLADIFASRQQALLKPLAEASLPEIDDADRRRCATPCSPSSPTQGVAETMQRLAAGAAPPLRRHRHGTCRCTSSTRSIARGARSRFRGGAQGAVRLRLRGQADGRGGRRRRRRRAGDARPRRSRIGRSTRSTQARPRRRKIFSEGDMARRRHLPPRAAASPATGSPARR